MEPFFWNIRTLDGFVLGAPIATVLFLLMVLCWDYPLLLVYRLFQRATGRSDVPSSGEALPVLVVIPSLLRQREELVSMMSTVESVANNGYPGELTIVVTIDGTTDTPLLYEELVQWAHKQYWNEKTRLHVTGSAMRRSKPMAIDHAIHYVKNLVAEGMLPAFPPVYVSTDADADLGPRALEHIVYRLQRKNFFTGAPARVVAGALHVRKNAFWEGWRHFFTVRGQLNLQVAREYYVGNIWRYNVRWLPITGVPGAFYCTWSEIFLTIPQFMGYMRTLQLRHWLAWWIGIAPPRFADCKAPPIPELMAGDTDDTVTAYAATMARYVGGRFCFEPPRTPFHALGHMLLTLFVDRPLKFAHRAHVFTSSPVTPKALFRQRKRWNSSRVELTGRFWNALGYYWELTLPVTIVKVLIVRGVLVGMLIWLVIPAVIWDGHALTALIVGYVTNVITYGVMTAFALSINGDLSYWRMALALPLAPAYNILFNWLPGAVGVTSDLLLFGNRTGFAPESTLLKGNSARVALLFRARRAALLTVRAALIGDVPLGRFWFGWRATRWTSSGFEGWSTGKTRAILPSTAVLLRHVRAQLRVRWPRR